MRAWHAVRTMLGATAVGLMIVVTVKLRRRMQRLTKIRQSDERLTTLKISCAMRFLEGPRWHDGCLWLVDMHSKQILRVDHEGRCEIVVEGIEAQPSGLGFGVEGELLIVSMKDKRLLRYESGGLEEVADLSKVAGHEG